MTNTPTDRETWQDLSDNLRVDVRDLASAVYRTTALLDEPRNVPMIAAGLVVACHRFAHRFDRRMKDAEAKAKRQ